MSKRVRPMTATFLSFAASFGACGTTKLVRTFAHKLYIHQLDVSRRDNGTYPG